jgi:hypothetical protein
MMPECFKNITAGHGKRPPHEQHSWDFDDTEGADFFFRLKCLVFFDFASGWSLSSTTDLSERRRKLEDFFSFLSPVCIGAADLWDRRSGAMLPLEETIDLQKMNGNGFDLISALFGIANHKLALVWNQFCGFKNVARRHQPMSSVIAFAVATLATAATVSKWTTLGDGTKMPTMNLGTCCGSTPAVGLEPWIKAGGARSIFVPATFLPTFAWAGDHHVDVLLVMVSRQRILPARFCSCCLLIS